MLNKKVKIVATIGPASRKYETLIELVKEGVNVIRINFSHEKHDTAVDLIKDIRRVEKELARPIAIMGDLCGPKIRIGDVEPGVFLKAGDIMEVVEESIIGNKERISLNYPSIVRDLKEDAEIYIDDGKIKLKVQKPTKDGVMAVVTVGGELKARKGFYGQGVSLDLDGLTEKDQEDLDFLLTQDVDAIALSFVQTAEDIYRVKKQLPEKNAPWIVTKLETAKGIENIDEILEATDVLMLARGDMGLAVPMEEVPHLQKRLIHMCLKKAKPVITATQMLESMTTNSLPTRAEVTDVANAILDGTDAVMLSAETASGDFPIETVKMMAQIIRRAVAHVPTVEFPDEKQISNAISASAGKIATQVGARVIVVFTDSGTSAKRVSRHRSGHTILALSTNESTVRRLCFSAGVYSTHIHETKGFVNMLEQAKKHVKENHIVTLEDAEPYIIVAGMPYGQAGTTNMILVQRA